MYHSLLLSLLRQQRQQQKLQSSASLKLLVQKATASKKQIASTIPRHQQQQQKQQLQQLFSLLQHQQQQQPPTLLLPKCCIISTYAKSRDSCQSQLQLQLQQQRLLSTLIHNNFYSKNNNNGTKKDTTKFNMINHNDNFMNVHLLQRLVDTTEIYYRNTNNNFFFFSSQSKSQSKQNSNNHNNSNIRTNTTSQSQPKSTFKNKSYTNDTQITHNTNKTNPNNNNNNKNNKDATSTIGASSNSGTKKTGAIQRTKMGTNYKLSKNEIQIRTNQILSKYNDINSKDPNTITDINANTKTTASTLEFTLLTADIFCMIQWWRDLSTVLHFQQKNLFENNENNNNINKHNKQEVSTTNTNATTTAAQNQNQNQHEQRLFLLQQKRYELQDQSIYAFNISLFLLSHVMVEMDNSISNTVNNLATNCSTSTGSTTTTKTGNNIYDNTTSNVICSVQEQIVNDPLYNYWMHDTKFYEELYNLLNAYEKIYEIEAIRARFIYNTYNTIYSNYNTNITTTTSTTTTTNNNKNNNNNEQLQAVTRLQALNEFTNTLHHLLSPYEIYNYLSNTIFERPALDTNTYYTFISNSFNNTGSGKKIDINNHNNTNRKNNSNNSNASTEQVPVVLSGQQIVSGLATIAYNPSLLSPIMVPLKSHLFGIHYRASKKLINDIQQEQLQQQQQSQQIYSNTIQSNEHYQPVLSKNEKLQQFQIYAHDFALNVLQRYLTSTQIKSNDNDENNYSNNKINNDNNNNNSSVIRRLVRKPKTAKFIRLLFESIASSSHDNAFDTINNVYSGIQQLYQSENHRVPTSVFNTYLRSLVMSSKTIDNLDFIRTILLESIIQYYENKNNNNNTATKLDLISCLIALSGYLLAQQKEIRLNVLKPYTFTNPGSFFPPRIYNGQRIKHRINYHICNTINDTQNALELNYILKEKSFFLVKDIYTLVNYMENNMPIANINDNINGNNNNNEQGNSSTGTIIETQTQTGQYTTTTTGNSLTHTKIICTNDIKVCLLLIFDGESDDVFYNIKNTYTEPDLSLVYQNAVEKQNVLKRSMNEFLKSLEKIQEGERKQHQQLEAERK